MKFIYPPRFRQPPADPAPMLPPPIPPSNPRHHQFALNCLALHSLVDSYLLAGFQCKRTTAYVNAHRLSRRPDVAAFLETSRRNRWSP